jgi:nitroimidazol reductase NimA-like FMN-containing flavoprotein (pyridoxamine 5'-phosphate oxidase superfamily)
MTDTRDIRKDRTDPQAGLTTSASPRPEAAAEDAYAPTDRTKFKRLAYRGSYDRATVHAVLDEGFICQVGFVVDGKPFVIPTAYGRVGDRLLLHGSASNRMLRALAGGAEACISVTLVDGLVFARSAFHHSVNYRSVIVFARGEEVTDPDEKLEALRVIVEHVVPKRWDAVRVPTTQEVAMTKVVAFPIVEASAKTRTGPPIDDEADYALPVWAGELPLRTVTAEPVPCPRLPAGMPVAAEALGYRRPGR